MRVIVLACAALTLTACDSGSVPPPGQEPLRASTPQVANDEVKLRADGLVAGPEAFYYAAGQNEVVTAIAKALGEEGTEASNAECGAGPMTFVSFGQSLTINFQSGSLVGWTQSDMDEKVSVVGDLAIGLDRAAAAKVDGFAPVAEGTMGEEFSVGQIGGFIEGDKVAMLYAGKQCFFR